MSESVSHIKVIDLSHLLYLLEDIEDLFEETISLEILVADFMATLFNLETKDKAEEMLLEDYDAADLFILLTTEDKALVYEKLTMFFFMLKEIFLEYSVEDDTLSPWQVLGSRGHHHILLCKTIREAVNDC